MIDINKNPTRRELRQFAGLFLVVFGGIGFMMLFRFDQRTAACAIWAVALGVSSLGLAWPRTIRPVYLGMMYLAFPIGWVVSHVLLAVVFYLVLTPIGLFMRLFGRDPLDRDFDAGSSTYWTKHQRADAIERYFRQF